MCYLHYIYIYVSITYVFSYIIYVINICMTVVCFLYSILVSISSLFAWIAHSGTGPALKFSGTAPTKVTSEVLMGDYSDVDAGVYHTGIL